MKNRKNIKFIPPFWWDFFYLFFLENFLKEVVGEFLFVASGGPLLSRVTKVAKKTLQKIFQSYFSFVDFLKMTENRYIRFYWTALAYQWIVISINLTNEKFFGSFEPFFISISIIIIVFCSYPLIFLALVRNNNPFFYNLDTLFQIKYYLIIFLLNRVNFLDLLQLK